ncbi:MAG: hypothetical protein QXU18_12825 [Thermoplasmatales archaeon]
MSAEAEKSFFFSLSSVTRFLEMFFDVFICGGPSSLIIWISLSSIFAAPGAYAMFLVLVFVSLLKGGIP